MDHRSLVIVATVAAVAVVALLLACLWFMTVAGNPPL